MIVEGDHERVRAFQLLEHLARVVDLQDGVAQRRRHLPQDRCREQEAPTLLRLAVEHHLDEVVGDLALVSGDGLGDVLRGHGLVQGVQGECDPGRPSLRPLAQKPESLLGQVCAGALGERECLIGIEGKLIGADLEEVPRQALAREPQVCVGACRENNL